jgi:hypothetical protein
MPEHLFVRVLVDSDWAAVTQPHLAVINRTDPWHWIVFNDRAIGETPEFTRTVIQHELDHAADYERDLIAFETTHPRPTTTPPRAYGFPAEAATVHGWTDEWGLYINAFIAFQHGRVDPARHLAIIVAQHAGPDAARWSAQEHEYWFELVFRQLPPDVAADQPLAGEDVVLAGFAAAGPALQRAVVQRAYDAVREALDPDPLADPAVVRAARANARTLVQHFAPIIERVRVDHLWGRPLASVLRQLSSTAITY